MMCCPDLPCTPSIRFPSSCTDIASSGMVYDDAEILYAEIKRDGELLLEEAFSVLFPASVPLVSRTKLPPLICAAFGAVAMCISLILALQKAWTSEGSAKICA